MATEQVLKTLEHMLNAYNYDGSDPQTDYFNVNFWGHAEYSYTILQAEREEYKQSIASQIEVLA